MGKKFKPEHPNRTGPIRIHVAFIRCTFPFWNQKMLRWLRVCVLRPPLPPRLFLWNAHWMASSYFTLATVGFTGEVACNRHWVWNRTPKNTTSTRTITSCAIFASYRKYLSFDPSHIKWQCALRPSVIVRVLWGKVYGRKSIFFPDEGCLINIHGPKSKLNNYS